MAPSRPMADRSCMSRPTQPRRTSSGGRRKGGTRSGSPMTSPPNRTSPSRPMETQSSSHARVRDGVRSGGSARSATIHARWQRMPGRRRFQPMDGGLRGSNANHRLASRWWWRRSTAEIVERWSAISTFSRRCRQRGPATADSSPIPPAACSSRGTCPLSMRTMAPCGRSLISKTAG